MESIEGDCTLNMKNSTIKSKGEEYFEEVEKRKNKIQKKRIIERHLKLEKIAKIHQNNLDRIAAEKEAQTINRSSSAPYIFENNLNLINDKNDEIILNKQK